MRSRLLTTQGDVERRMGLIPLEELHAERDELIRRVAPLRAKYGSFGTWDALRKIEVSKIAAIVRGNALADGKKLSDRRVDELAHGDERYADFVIKATEERGEWIRLESLIEGIADQVNRGQAVARFLSQEAGLAR